MLLASLFISVAPALKFGQIHLVSQNDREAQEYFRAKGNKFWPELDLSAKDCVQICTIEAKTHPPEYGHNFLFLNE